VVADNGGMSLHRQVFFFGGFDPRTPRHYHRLYRAAVRERQPEAGEQVKVGPRQEASATRDEWDVHWHTPDGETLRTRYAVMRWDDIVLQHWPRHLRQALKDLYQLHVRAQLHGVLTRVRRHAPNMRQLAQMPLYVASGTAVAVALVMSLLSWLTPLPAWLAAVLGVAAWLPLWRTVEKRLDGEWLLRLYAFVNAFAEGRVPAMDARLDALADELVQQARQSRARELLVVGHSVGAIMAVSVLARAVQKAPELGAPGGPQIALLTLGHCTPLMVWQLPADKFREELVRLRAHAPLVWWDFTAPADWAAMAQIPPWMDGNGAAAQLEARSPRFHQQMSPEAYAQLRRDRHRLHMHYLHAPERAGGYDPVTLTAGPLTLADRQAALAKPRAS